MLSLDTHRLTHSPEDAPSSEERWTLAADEYRAFQQFSGTWEIAKIPQIGRIELDLEDPRIRRPISRIWTATSRCCLSRGLVPDLADPPRQLDETFPSSPPDSRLMLR